jgi:hypothetical protein
MPDPITNTAEMSEEERRRFLLANAAGMNANAHPRPSIPNPNGIPPAPEVTPARTIPEASLSSFGGGPSSFSSAEIPKPKESAWQKIEHGIGKFGNILGNTFIPGAMERIPGTQLNREFEENRRARLASEEARTGLEKAKTWEALNPDTTPKTPFEAFQQNPNDPNVQKWRDLTKPPDTKAELPAEIQAWQKIPGNEKKSVIDYEREKAQAIGEGKPEPQRGAKEQIQQQLNTELAKPAPDQKIIKGLQDRLRTIDPLAEDRLRDAEARAADAAKRSGEKTDLGTREKVLTYFKPAQDADVRLGLMEESMEKALKGDQQAMVNLVANHVAMVLGMPRGKVPRVSHEFFMEAEQAAPILQRAEAHFNKEGYLSGIVLTPDQMKYMVDLGKQTRDKEWESANSSADYIGINPNDRPKSIYKGGGGTGGGGAGNEQPVYRGGQLIGYTVDGKTINRTP